MNDGLIQDGAEVGGAFPSLVESDPSESTAATWQREARAVKLTGRRQKVFSMHRWRKYDPDLLSAHLGTMGWETLAQLPCGSSPKNQAAVLVLRKRSG